MAEKATIGLRLSTAVPAVPAEDLTISPLLWDALRPGYRPSVPLREEIIRSFGTVVSLEEYQWYVTERVLPNLPSSAGLQPADALAGLLYTLENLQLSVHLNAFMTRPEPPLLPSKSPAEPVVPAPPPPPPSPGVRCEALLYHLLRLSQRLPGPPAQLWRGAHLPATELALYRASGVIAWPHFVSLTTNCAAAIATFAPHGAPGAAGRLVPVLFGAAASCPLVLSRLSPFAPDHERLCRPYTLFRVLGVEGPSDTGDAWAYTCVTLQEVPGPLPPMWSAAPSKAGPRGPLPTPPAPDGSSGSTTSGAELQTGLPVPTEGDRQALQQLELRLRQEVCQ